MSYIVDYGELDALMSGYNGAISTWRSAISTMMGQADAVKGSSNISGNSADRLRDYLDMTYSWACATLSTVLEMFQKNFLLYTEAYHQQVDASGETHIDEEELSEHRTSLQGKRSQMQQIALSAETTVRGISDLVALPSLDIGEADAEFGTILTSLDDLDAAVNGVESAYTSGGVTEINELISNARAFLVELCQQSEEFKTSFTVASFAGLASVPGLLVSMKKANTWLTTNESDVAAAVEHLEERLAIQQAEYEKRQEQVKWAKAAVTVVTTIASAAAIATGVGTLFVPVICGVGRSAFNAAADEYASYGWNTAQWDNALIGKEAVKGWFTGFTGAILPPGTGDVVKAGLSSVNSALWGGLDNAYNQLTTTGTISDTTSIFFDAEKSGVSSFAGELAGNAISDQVKDMPIGLGLDKYTNPSNDIRHYVGEFIAGGVDKVASGVGERFVSTSVEIAYDAERNYLHGQSAFEGIDLGEEYKGVLSLEDIGMDFVKGGSKEAVSSYITERTPDPNTGLTPIIQAKLGYETDPETGLTAVVQDSLAHIVDEEEFSGILAEMEERNPSTGAGMVTPESMDLPRNESAAYSTSQNAIDWQNTSNTPEELRQIEEMEQRGEFEIDGVDYSSVKVTSNFEEPQFPTMRTPTENAGIWLGERGNSGYIPDNPAAQAVMREYGQDSVAIHNSHPDFSPFSVHDTPWGTQTCEVEIGHMVPQRAEADGNYKQADEELAKMIGGGVTRDDVRQYREQNKLTWHEVEDGKTMQLIPTVINSSVAHTGGVSISGYGQKMGDISHDYE